jgi:hypothetical protein
VSLARSTTPFTPSVAVAFGAAIGLVLVIVDIVTRGSLSQSARAALQVLAGDLPQRIRRVG